VSKTLDRLAKVLAQADGAATDGERDAFMEKAMALSAASGIELAVARAHQANKEKREEPEERAVTVNDYSRTRARDYFMKLFSAIVAANDCKLLIGYKSYRGFVLGFPSDIDVIEALYATLAVQMEADADAAIRRGENIVTGEKWDSAVGDYVEVTEKLDGRIWRREFYDGFIARVTSRLWEAKRAARTKAGADDESSSTAVALRDKSREVDDFYDSKTSWRRMGTWEPSSTSGYSSEARRAGQAAGARASLGRDDDHAMSGSRRAALDG
jgi:Protein of unknown function (DUF2786)